MADYKSLIEKAAFGVPASWEKLPRHSEAQQQAIGRSLERGEQMLDNPYQGFEPIRQNVLRSYKEDIIPEIASRIGSIPGGRFSTGASGLYQMAERGLEQRLAALQAQYGQQQQQLGQQQLGMGLTQLNDYYPVTAQAGLAQSIGPQIASGTVQAIPQLIGKAVEAGSEFLPAGFRQAGQLAGRGIEALGNLFTGRPGPSPQLLRDLPLQPQARQEAREQWIASEAQREGIDLDSLGFAAANSWLERKRNEWNQALQGAMMQQSQQQQQKRMRSPEGIMEQKALGTYTPTISEKVMAFARRIAGGQ